MNMTVVIDKAGRVVLPKSVRDELRVTSGDTLNLKLNGDEVVLSPTRSTSPLRRERGVWVFRRGKPIHAAVTDNLLDQLRGERDQTNRGG